MKDKEYRKYEKTRNKLYSLLNRDDDEGSVMSAMVDTLTDTLGKDALKWVKDSLKVQKEIEKEEKIRRWKIGEKMNRAKKITELRKAVDSATQTVAVLIETLFRTREDAIVLETRAKAELDEATEEYEIVMAGYKELQSQCDKTIVTIDKIVGWVNNVN